MELVVVKYEVVDVFIVPDGIDLNDKTKVKEWFVKWNTLTIIMVDGTEHEIDNEGGVENFDYKHPYSTEVQRI